MKCRFKFDRIFTKKITVAQPLQNMLSQVKKFEIINKRSNILRTVRNDIDIKLDPRHTISSNDKSIREIFSSI